MADIRVLLCLSGLRLNQPQDRMRAAATSADTDEHGRVCVGGLGPYALLLKPTIGAPAACRYAPFACTSCRGGADDVTGLLTAALTASIHANRPPCQRRPGLHSLPVRWQPGLLLLVSGCSGRADGNRPSANAAGSCS